MLQDVNILINENSLVGLNDSGLKVQRLFFRTESPILLDYKVSVRTVIRIVAMMFEVLIHKVVTYISGTPSTIANCPKMLPPIFLAQYWEFLLQQARASAFKPFYNITDAL